MITHWAALTSTSCLKRFIIFSGCGAALLFPCQVEQLKEELSQSQSEKEELRQRANELQQEAAAVREAPLCSRSRSFFFRVFPVPPRLLAPCLTRFLVRWNRRPRATVTSRHCGKPQAFVFRRDPVQTCGSGGQEVITCTLLLSDLWLPLPSRGCLDGCAAACVSLTAC